MSYSKDQIDFLLFLLEQGPTARNDLSDEQTQICRFLQSHYLVDSTKFDNPHRLAVKISEKGKAVLETQYQDETRYEETRAMAKRSFLISTCSGAVALLSLLLQVARFLLR